MLESHDCDPVVTNANMSQIYSIDNNKPLEPDEVAIPCGLMAKHYFNEIYRAEQGAIAWKNGDMDAYGKLVFESGKSSIENYECGCPELIRLYDIMTKTDGIYGGRFSGAGFKGCCMALIDPEKEEQVLSKVSEAYLKEYPSLKGKYQTAICHSDNGVGIDL